MVDLAERARFFRGFIRRPREVGSIIPSSRFLEQRIVRLVDATAAQTVVELGPGTGGTTRAVLAGLPADARLLAIDTSPDFVRALQQCPDGRLIAQQGSAEALADILRGHALPAPDVIFSGIPFSTMPRATALGILEAVWAALAPGGRFMAYQFRDEVYRLGATVMGEPLVECEWLNLPPMHCYSWDKPMGEPGTSAQPGSGGSPLASGTTRAL